MGYNPLPFVVGYAPAKTIAALWFHGIGLSNDHLRFVDFVHLLRANKRVSVVNSRSSQLHQHPFVQIVYRSIHTAGRSGIIPISSLDRNYFSVDFLMWKGLIVVRFQFGDTRSG